MRMARSQREKCFCQLAGEYYVAAELNRRGIMAALTYGAAKSADIIATNDQNGKACIVEVKTAQAPNKSWRVVPDIGERPNTEHMFWVLVLLPLQQSEMPRFFVFSEAGLAPLYRTPTQEYLARYEAKHGKPYSGAGYPQVQSKHVPPAAEGRWHIITDYLEIRR